jgi:Fur family ferric uptake transcriptional regulator
MDGVSDHDHWAQEALAALQRAGRRRGSARKAVVERLAGLRCALGAREIDDGLRASGQRVGLTSVYRALGELEQLGLVRRVEVGDGTARYEPRRTEDEDHHHHLVCDRCGNLIPFSDAGLESAIAHVSDRLDFSVDDHEVLLHGACAACAS